MEVSQNPPRGEVPKGRRGLWYWVNCYIIAIKIKRTCHYLKLARPLKCVLHVIIAAAMKQGA